MSSAQHAPEGPVARHLLRRGQSPASCIRAAALSELFPSRTRVTGNLGEQSWEVFVPRVKVVWDVLCLLSESSSGPESDLVWAGCPHCPVRGGGAGWWGGVGGGGAGPLARVQHGLSWRALSCQAHWAVSDATAWGGLRRSATGRFRGSCFTSSSSAVQKRAHLFGPALGVLQAMQPACFPNGGRGRRTDDGRDGCSRRLPREGPWLSLHCGLSRSISKRVLGRTRCIARETRGRAGNAGAGA